ncbi:MAG TPA: hypothetical protein VJ842_19600, partial [Pyrinomonadaceae bacterium]|nr:hypothetical protein [Pyrinomonadaceae bacterium]
MRPPTRLMASLLLLILAASVSSAHDISLPLEETAQNADLIFIGTVAKQTYRLNDAKTMIFTDVLFRDIKVLHGTNRSKQKASSEVLLTYAGGRLGDLSISVGEAPTLSEGHRYLIFMSDDGITYANPIIGGKQGLFEIVKDSASQDEYVLTAGQKPIIGVGATGIVVGAQRVTSVVNGSAVNAMIENADSDGLYSQPPVSASADDSASLADKSADRLMKQARPLKLEEFADFVTNVSLKMSFENKAFKRGGQGLYYKRNGDDIVSEELQMQTRLPVRIPSDLLTGDTTSQKTAPHVAALSPNPVSVAGGQVGACGYQNLKIVMEQESTSSSSYSINNDVMFTWNQFMDIYRFTADDGTFGNNSTNEFAGFVTDSTLNSTYGFHWNGGLGITVIYRVSNTDCSRIAQTDVMWNPAYSWTNDANVALGNRSVILLRPVAAHETGHVWGLQTGTYTETYDYDVATVMQPYNYDVVEDGRGIHRADAYLVRRIYQDQTGILSTKDIGVESYYASNGLRNSTTNASTYSPGQSITLFNVTAENMSYSAVSDMRIRFFLSTNRTISTTDYQLGSYWFWTTFNSESYSVGNYTTTIPSNIPPGTYYVGAIVTLNGFDNDDYTTNNSTSFFSPITIVSGGSRAQMTSPANGATLTSSPVTFSWTSGSGVSNYYLYVGTSPGGNNIFNNFVSSSSQTVGVPIGGSDLYVRLWS